MFVHSLHTRLQLKKMSLMYESARVAITFQLLEMRESSGRVLDSRPKGRGFESHWRHCVVVLEQDTFILA